jgi:hypothetical protein
MGESESVSVSVSVSVVRFPRTVILSCQDAENNCETIG